MDHLGRPADHLLVVGAGLAGLSAARAARTLGFTGRLTLLGAEPHPPYDRPPLSKDYLAGRLDRDGLALAGVEEDLRLERRTGTAVALQPGDRSVVHTADGARIEADGVVLASGARARTLPEVPEDANVHVLRTVDDADRLRAGLTPGARLVVVGSGLVGAEVAATATGLGCRVTVLTVDAVPFAALYGPRLAPHLSALHTRAGVEVRPETKITGVARHDGRVVALQLADGDTVGADVVLVAVGAEPEVGWLRGSGLALGDGVLADRYGRALAEPAAGPDAPAGPPVPGVVAVGDCAAWWEPHLQRHHRTQHWTDALERPALALATLLQVPPPGRKPYLPYFWSDQYDARIQLAGFASLADEVEVTDGDPAGDLGADGFLAIYRRAGEPVAVLGVSRPREFTRWRKTLAATLGRLPELPTGPSPVAAPAAAAPAQAAPEPATPEPTHPTTTRTPGSR